MTISMVWVRKVSTVEELVFATDSRLRAGNAWDCGPKIFLLHRGDCAICFAGFTYYTYPIMEQFRNAIAMYPRARDRSMDLLDLKGHTLRVVQQMSTLISDPPKNAKKVDPPDAEFIFAGYSWKQARFRIWVLRFHGKLRRFIYYDAEDETLGNEIAIIGDYVTDAKVELTSRLRGKDHAQSGFNMEPFEVLRGFCRDTKRPEIGGAPQILKIYKHMNAMPYAVYWPNRESSQISLMGRPLLPYEKAAFLVLDPDTLKTEDPWPNPTAQSRPWLIPARERVKGQVGLRTRPDVARHDSDSPNASPPKPRRR
jgi:hypothetical protein